MSDWRLPYYDRQGRPISQAEAMLLICNREARRVAEDWVGTWQVSTVHLVLDHSHGAGPPIIFETMIFQRDDNASDAMHDLYCERYPTEAAALAGHDRALAWLHAWLAELAEVAEVGQHNDAQHDGGAEGG